MNLHDKYCSHYLADRPCRYVPSPSEQLTWLAQFAETLERKVSKQIAELERQVAQLETRLTMRHVDYQRQINEILDGIGGAVWRTAEGHARGIALLSSEHLRNIIAWPNVSAKVRQLCREELARREIDDAWRQVGHDIVWPKTKAKRKLDAPAKKAKAKRKPAKRRRK